VGSIFTRSPLNFVDLAESEEKFVMQGLPMFKAMAAEDLETSFDSFERKEYRRGDLMYCKGEVQRCISILRSGELAIDDTGSSLPELGGFAYMGVDHNGLQVNLFLTSS